MQFYQCQRHAGVGAGACKMAPEWHKYGVGGLWGGPSLPWVVLNYNLIPRTGVNMPKSMPFWVV